MLGRGIRLHTAIATKDRVIVYGEFGMQILNRKSLQWKKVPGVTMGADGHDGNYSHSCTLLPKKRWLLMFGGGKNKEGKVWPLDLRGEPEGWIWEDDPSEFPGLKYV